MVLEKTLFFFLLCRNTVYSNYRHEAVAARGEGWAGQVGAGQVNTPPSSSCVDGPPAVGTKVEVLALLALLALLSQTE